MEDSLPPQPEPPRTPRSARLAQWAFVACKVLCAGFGVATTAMLVRLALRWHPVSVDWTLQLLLALVASLSSLLVWIHLRRQWTRPTRELNQLLQRILDGESPIEELSTIQGGPASLVPVLRDILHDWKSRRAAVTQLKEEMRQRIASRTDALERVVGSLRQQANRDALTGLYNRRAMDQYLPTVLEKTIETRDDLCVLMIDVDHFKPLNDTLGHGAGDQLLKSIGDLIRSTIRDHDFAFRYGGDEFSILMPSCDARAGNSLAQRLVSLVDALVKPMRLTQSPRLSIGVATLSELPDPWSATPQALLHQADKNLYAVKAHRRTTRPDGVAA